MGKRFIVSAAILKKQIKGEAMNIQIRKGTKDDTERFIQFLAQVQGEMEHKEWFFLDPPELVRDLMNRGVMQLWLAMDGDRIAAIFDYLRPGLDEMNYGYDLRLSDELLHKVINLDNAAVHPDYRGLGLQRKMIRIAEKELKGQGNWILLCTVHPDNRFSLQNVLGQGYTIQKKLEKYGSVRYILRKDI